MSLILRKLEREDERAEAMHQAKTLLPKRREQIAELDAKITELNKAIDSINTLSGRASVGHGKDCECSYCLIHRIAFKVWKSK